ncbi:MAG: tRNA (adenosine(37)-N6)-threonylcarbamoyltransferase complex transferase subunit TsaD [Phycisphaerae bacterium]|nr:tRNA (adenosine(37)-N6)-threonylcarbamoyltransferase complex transferase subunit TsaD [Phycisphaerae bacterium]
MTTLLGIETSCDETAAAVVDDGRHVRSSVVASQIEFHRKFGGVVPEIASRKHLEVLNNVIAEALSDSGCSPDDLDAVAVTQGPGLVGALLIGVTAAKTLCWLWGKPLVAVDHICAHTVSPAIRLETPPWPAVALVVSGGHTTLFYVQDFLEIERLGATTDDAAGEAFDKVATILGLPYPGGPSIEACARDGDPRAVVFPRTMLGRESLDFSFSGIKTAVLYYVHGPGRTSGGLQKMSPSDIADTAASFQQAVVDVLVAKTMRAVSRTHADTVVLGGGVAANAVLRQALRRECEHRDLTLHCADLAYCGDNAVMIAAHGHHLFHAGQIADLALDVYSGTQMKR